MSPPKMEDYSSEKHSDLFTEALTIEPRNWTKAHVQVLPREYLLEKTSTFMLTKIWKDLPESIRNDEEIQSHLPCLEHYNRDEDTIHIDGPPPSKLRCRGCIRERRLRADKKKRDNDSNNKESGFQDDKRPMIQTSG